MSGQDELRERIARALLKFPLNDCHCPASSPCGWCAMASEEMADAVIAALGLRQEWDGEGAFWRTPWERIEEDR